MSQEKKCINCKHQQHGAIRHNNKSGVTGVSWTARDKKWRAQIGANGKVRSLGCFAVFADAVRARYKAEREMNKPYLKTSAYKYLSEYLKHNPEQEAQV